MAVDYTRIEAMVSQLVGAITEKPPVDPANDPAALRIEYQIVVDVIKLLSDIRFRCLVFVTAIVATANALLPDTVHPSRGLAVGLLGFVATLGITIYELRNSQLYEVAIHRAKDIERRLGMRGSSPHKGTAGLFAERPVYVSQDSWRKLTTAQKRDLNAPDLRFWLMSVSHDRGLALIYGAALGTWAYLVVYGLLALPVPAGLWPSASTAETRLVSVLVGIAAGGWSYYQFKRHDDKRLKQPKPGHPLD